MDIGPGTHDVSESVEIELHFQHVLSERHSDFLAACAVATGRTGLVIVTTVGLIYASIITAS